MTTCIQLHSYAAIAMLHSLMPSLNLTDIGPEESLLQQFYCQLLTMSRKFEMKFKLQNPHIDILVCVLCSAIRSLNKVKYTSVQWLWAHHQRKRDSELSKLRDRVNNLTVTVSNLKRMLGKKCSWLGGRPTTKYGSYSWNLCTVALQHASIVLIL